MGPATKSRVGSPNTNEGEVVIQEGSSLWVGWGLEAGCSVIPECPRHLRGEAEDFCGPEVGYRVDLVALRGLHFNSMVRTEDRRLQTVALQGPSWPTSLPLSHAPHEPVGRRAAILSRSVLAAGVTHGFLAVTSLSPKTCIYI